MSFPKDFLWEEAHSSIRAKNIRQLLRWLKDYRLEWGGDLSVGWEDRVCNTVCDDPDMSVCCSGGGANEQPERRLKVSDLTTFLHTVGRWVSEGGKLAPSATSESRGAICATCPQNVKVKGCMGCSGLLSKGMNLIKGASTPYDSQLDGCAVCGCALKVKVHIPIDVMVGGGDLAGFPDYCWIVTEKAVDK